MKVDQAVLRVVEARVLVGRTLRPVAARGRPGLVAHAAPLARDAVHAAQEAARPGNARRSGDARRVAAEATGRVADEIMILDAMLSRIVVGSARVRLAL